MEKSVQDLIDKLEKEKKRDVDETCILQLDDVQKLIEEKIDELKKPPKRKRVTFKSGGKSVAFYVKSKDNKDKIQILKEIHGGFGKNK